MIQWSPLMSLHKYITNRLYAALRYLRYFNQTPATRQAILDSSVEVSKQTKAVLDRLGRARFFLQTIMDFGAIASEVSCIS
jgi:ABC-type transport system involved in cytochrome bd biosynthesis fused ATPase/permease subunit